MAAYSSYDGILPTANSRMYFKFTEYILLVLSTDLLNDNQTLCLFSSFEKGGITSIE